jgi:glycosyltransferase involved in cell wall biosynthesis
MIPGKKVGLITAAYNEGANIEKTILSVLRQKLLPEKWIIVSDGSTDETDDIVKRYAAMNEAIQYIRRGEKNKKHSFASKAHALNEGYQKLKGRNYDFIGHIDADLSFNETYLENIIDQFIRNPRLGVAGGYVYEPDNGIFKSRKTNSPHSVAGGTQVFRRECYEMIGGLTPLELGGEDWYAEILSKMAGWEVEAFPEYIVYHHKPTGSSRGRFMSAFQGGIMDYCMGSHPLFEILKCIRRIQEEPFVLGASLRLGGFLWALIKEEKKYVPRDAEEFMRKEQLKRIGIRAIP